MAAYIVNGATGRSGRIAFERTAQAGCYELYFRPYAYQFTWWCGRFEVRYDREGQKLSPVDATVARTSKIQSRTTFDERPWVEQLATTGEMARYDEVELFANGIRDYKVDALRFRSRLPRRWLNYSREEAVIVRGRIGRVATLQLALWNPTSKPLEKVSVRSSNIEVTCINIDGVDIRGRPQTLPVSVPPNTLQPLFVLARPQDPNTTSQLVVEWDGGSRTVSVVHKCDETKEDPFEDLISLRRLEWLNSKVGHEDKVTEPYEPIGLMLLRMASLFQLTTAEIQVPAATVLAGVGNTLPLVTSATAYAGRRPTELLKAPITLRIVGESFSAMDAAGHVFNAAVSPSGARAKWGGFSAATTTSGRDTVSAKTKCSLDYDGYMICGVTLEARKNDVELEDVILEVPMAEAASTHAFGLDLVAGRRSEQKELSWKWKENQDKANNVIWVGSPDGGLWLQFLPERGKSNFEPLAPQWRIPQPVDGRSVPWAGDDREGEITVDKSGVITARCGPNRLQVGRPRTWAVAIMITPVKPHRKSSLFGDSRIFHAPYGQWVPPTLSSVKKLGANVVVLHQGNSLNPYINYPFSPDVMVPLRDYTNEAKKEEIKVKLYYTVRELSVRAAEIFALRSLGHEILPAATKLSAGGGASWLSDHFDDPDSYAAAWYTRLHDERTRFDQAIEDNGVSRWANYYLEGLRWLLADSSAGPQIDGLYLDGLAYDRDATRRMRRVADAADKPVLFDLHSGPNNYQHVAHMPYLDSLWVGERTNYEGDPDYWLVVVSGIVWGVPSQTLGADDCTAKQVQTKGCAAFFKSLVFGLTNRCGWNGFDPNHNHAVWSILDDFGFNDAEIFGWWEHEPTVQSDDPLVKATALVNADKSAVIVVVASWRNDPASVTLHVDWIKLGAPDLAHAQYTQPQLGPFQPKKSAFLQETAIKLDPHGGGLYVVRGNV